MTFELLGKIVEENNIPKNVKLMSDSGWECWETKMDGIFYNKEKNTLMFTQEGDKFDGYLEKDGWVCVYGKLKDYKDKNGYAYYECDNTDCISNVDGVCHKFERNNCEYNLR